MAKRCTGIGIGLMSGHPVDTEPETLDDNAIDDHALNWEE
jgi:hypothetical protein